MTSQQASRRTLLSALGATIVASSVTIGQPLPSAGTTSWEIQQVEAIVTFVLFDPKDPAVALPTGLRFMAAREIDAPEFQAHLKQHPEHSDWAFSFIEFVRPTTFRLDGKMLTLQDKAGIAVWFAPVDHSQLVGEIPKDKFESVIAPSPVALLQLGFWVPDRGYVGHMQARGHHAEYGVVKLVKDKSGELQGELRLANLKVTTSATPHGETRAEPDPFTQVLFAPGATVKNAVVRAGGNVRERSCTAKWTTKGDHPLSRGVFVGPTFQVIEGPFKGSAYRLVEEKDQ